MNLADQILFHLHRPTPDWVLFDDLAQAIRPGIYTSEEAAVLAAQIRELFDEGRIDVRAKEGVIHQLRLRESA